MSEPYFELSELIGQFLEMSSEIKLQVFLKMQDLSIYAIVKPVLAKLWPILFALEQE